MRPACPFWPGLLLCVLLQAQAFFFPTSTATCTRNLARHRSLSRLQSSTAESSTFSPSSSKFAFRVLNSISEIEKEEWDSLLDPGNPNPFLRHDWLNCLEAAGCASASQGWQPLHILMEKDDSVVAAIPLYAKFHSAGEFIFDHSWADFAERQLGIKYYPKLLAAVPFTPATGPRLLIRQGVEDAESLRLAMIRFVVNLTRDNKLLSFNVNFMPQDEVTTFLQSGFELRNTIQYRFTNLNSETGQKYTDFDDYLSQFKSKRRMQIKRERRSVYEEQKIRVEVIRGDEALATPELYQTMFLLYQTTIDKMWGQQYLNEDFFQRLAACDPAFRRHLVFVVAYDTNNDDKIVAGTVNVVSKTTFSGRYWGALPDSFVKNLHFECCYYKTIEWCIQEGIEYMEPGAGGGDFKFLRGFNPFLINSVHYFTQPTMQKAVAQFLDQERESNKKTSDYLIANSPLGTSGGGGGDDATEAD